MRRAALLSPRSLKKFRNLRDSDGWPAGMMCPAKAEARSNAKAHGSSIAEPATALQVTISKSELVPQQLQ